MEFNVFEMDDQQLMAYAEEGNLPVGYRFDPTDEDLVGCYLMEKTFGILDPTTVIRDFDVFETEPWNLPGDRNVYKRKKYFFLDMRSKYFDNIVIRAAGNGEWRTVERNRAISLPNTNFMGKKNTLAFWKMQDNRFVKTRWMMHEFRFATRSPPKVSVWNAYRVYKEARKKKGKGKSSGSTLPTVIEVPVEDGNGSGPPPPMSP